MGPWEAGTAPWGAARTSWHPGTPPGLRRYLVAPRDPPRGYAPGRFSGRFLVIKLNKQKDSNTLDRHEGSADQQMIEAN